MNKNNYDPKVISTFEIIGSFFVDTFYNNLYLRAKDIVMSGRGQSITDAYKNNIISYINGMSTREDLYASVVRQLHEYFRASSAFSAIAFSDFEDRILSQFIPKEYYSAFTDINKDITLKKILLRGVSDLSMCVIKPEFLKRAIDKHMDRYNVVNLQDKSVEIFILIREEYFTKFAKLNSKHITNMVPKELIEKLKETLTVEIKRRYDAEKERDKLVVIVGQLLAKIKELQIQQPQSIRPQRTQLQIPPQVLPQATTQNPPQNTLQIPPQDTDEFNLFGDCNINKEPENDEKPIDNLPDLLIDNVDSSWNCLS